MDARTAEVELRKPSAQWQRVSATTVHAVGCGRRMRVRLLPSGSGDSQGASRVVPHRLPVRRAVYLPYFETTQVQYEEATVDAYDARPEPQPYSTAPAAKLIVVGGGVVAATP